MSPDSIAQSAQLAMLLELSSSPKPGNVDRCHDHPDIGFHHFLASAVLVYPVFRRAAQGQEGLGRLIREAVSVWREWGLDGNTHFGEITLLMPLAAAAGRGGLLEEEVARVLECTTVEDSSQFYRAFAMAGARVAEVGQFSLQDEGAAEEVARQGKTLLELMKLSRGHDLVAREWATGCAHSFMLSDILMQECEARDLNDAVVVTFLRALAAGQDSLVRSKFGEARAREVSSLAKSALSAPDILASAREMDLHLLQQDINPGSTADLIGAALFISLHRGLKF
ncbi:MAG: triphosphoribosyl-dephospho-CoA synthase [Methanosarcinales archaeon]|nr:triphosphoribosyl-dephospho-CoA synthase [Methanosarcinales archaeon]